MQMKAVKPAPRLNVAKMRELLAQENEFVTNLLAINDVPDSIHDDTLDQHFLLKSKQQTNSAAHKKAAAKTAANRATSADALQERLETMKNKMGAKKSKPSERTIKKRQLKKLKKDGELKRRIVGVAKSLKNEASKESKAAIALQIKREQDGEQDTKPDVKPPAVYNEDGKMVFSKFEFAAQSSKAKKSKKDKVIKNPKLLLQNIKKQKKEISELIEQGDVDKAAAIKQELAWKKAFDKTEGKAVKDNTTLLHKTIKRKKVLKKKSKTDWKERTAKVEKDKEGRQKKRNENIKKKQDEKKKNKLKKLSKRGRIIPGY